MLRLFLKIINFYQKHKPSSLHGVCIYYPSCSEYTKLALIKYGIFKGSCKSIKRLKNCNSRNQGGFDFP